MTRPRRVRASFALRCVILAASLAVFLGFVWLADSVGRIAGAVVFLIAFWFVGLEGGLLPILIERLAVRRARRTGSLVESIWFVDLEQQDQADRDRFERETRDNPTLR